MMEYDYKLASATREVAILEGQANRLRTELIKLRRDVALANRELASAKRDLVSAQLELAPARRELARIEEESFKFLSKQAWVHAAELREANEQLVLAALRAENSAETALNHLSEVTQASQRDVLTGTPNRALMLDRLNSAIALARRNDAHIALLFLDLDYFKQINDTLGHCIGDEVLRLVTRRLEAVVRDSDTVSRHSGDEFLILLTEVSHASDAALIAEKMLSVLSAASHARLVDDLLDGSRMTTGKLHLELEKLELIDVLDAALDCCRPAIDSRHQLLTFRRLTDSVCIRGDLMRLIQVFSNLLDNASKYTPEGGQIGIAVDIKPTEVAVTISDNGIGITEAALPHIFDLFVQDTYGLTHNNAGLGIGLAVVRNLVEAHQGTVTVRSGGANCGSEFIVTLPVA